MKVALVPIGNLRGIRIPKALIDLCRFGDTLELSVEYNRLTLSPGKQPREGWEESFQAATLSGAAPLLIDDTLPSAFDKDDWQW